MRVRSFARQGPAVSRHLFGKFTEHLGRNVYGGAWAQAVTNPAFAPASTWPDRAELLRRLQQAGPACGLPALSSAMSRALPPWWLAEGDLGWEGDGGRHPALTVWSPAGDGRLITPLELPVHRTTRYLARLRLRCDMPLEIALQPAGQGPWAVGRIPACAEWTTREVALEGGAAAPAVGTPLHLTVTPAHGGCLQLRSLLVLPQDHLDGWDPDVVRLLREARLPLLRWPGGNFVSGYHWRDGVGPLEDRPVLANPAWPEVEWNHVGSDEWLRLCELVGCEPLVCVNAGDGSPQEAADWVEYCNGEATTRLGALRALNGHPRPYGVRLWEVGNELYGHWQIGAVDAATYAARYGAYLEAMRGADPALRAIANGAGADWNRTVAFAGGGSVRCLSHHGLYGGFADGDDPRAVYLEHMAFTPAYRRLWDELAAPMRETGQVPRLAITELQVFTRKPGLPNNATLTEAVWTASILNEAIRADGLVELVTHSALVNHGGGLRKERGVVYPQPVWWTTHLYGTAAAPLFRLELEVETPTFDVPAPRRMPTAADAPFLDAVAAVDGSGQTLVFFLINRHPERSLRVRVALPPEADFDTIDVQTLTGDSFMAVNRWDRPDAVAPVHHVRPWTADPWILPPCSLVRLCLLRGRAVEPEADAVAPPAPQPSS